MSCMNTSTVTEHTSWAVNPYSWLSAERLATELNLPLVAGMVLAGRGLSDVEDARRFLDCTAALPDPFLFGDMERAVTVISRAIDEGRRLIVHGDYDADGITATAVMLLGLRELGLEAEWYLPSRFKEGYGLSRHAVDTIAAGGPAVLVTVDCGVNYPDEVEYGKGLGLDVVVVDHHTPGPRLPDCPLIHASVGAYPHADLCGVGLALKVLHALHISRRGATADSLPETLRGLLDLVAIGTVADLASLWGENRYYVKEGLKLVSIGHRLGIRMLCSVAGCTGQVDSGTVAYRLAPRLNAAGRLADPSPPLRLLLSENEEEASVLAAHLHELNGARQDVERQILEDAVRSVEALDDLPPALVVAGEGWHEGVVGIVASRLVERYHRPAILLGIRDGTAKGSGRSVSAYDLMSGLNACAEHLTVFGGHRQAVGLTLEEDRLDQFRCAIEAHAARMLEPSDFVPVYRADAIIRGEDAGADTASALAALGPFGTGNPRPRLLMVGAGLEQAEVTRNGGHLRCVVEVDGVRTRGIGFGMADMAAILQGQPGPRLVGAQLRVDEWQGTLRPEFVIERIGPVGDSEGLSDSFSEDCMPVTTAAAQSARAGSLGGPACTESVEGSRAVGPAALHLSRVRDLRDARDSSSWVAQVLASDARVLLLVCSLPQALSALRGRIPMCRLWGGEVSCVSRGSSPDERMDLAAARVGIAEWDVGDEVFPLSGDYAHVIALDPPYRPRHVGLLQRVESQGSVVHLCYGERERSETGRLLRYLVHPRFAMVCLFRAMREGGRPRVKLYSRAMEMAVNESGVALTWGDLERAASILEELGVEQVSPGEAKLDARSVAIYAAAEADYEECSRFCLTL